IRHIYLISMRQLILSISFLGFLLIPGSSFSQTQGVLSKKWYGNWSVGVGGGPTIFYGDMNPYRIAPGISTFNEIKYAGTFYLIRQLSHVFALRGQALYGEIYSFRKNYSDGKPMNQSFTGNILEYNLNTTINFSNLLFRYKPKRIFFIYGTVGVGMSNWITKKTDLVTGQSSGGSGSASNWTTEWVIPAGLGAYFTIYDKVNLGVEWTLRGVNSDKLDATVGGFQYDLYSYISLNLVFNFNRRNPVKLDAVKATMPPVVLAKSQPPAPESPVKSDTVSITRPAPFSSKQLTPMPVATTVDTLTLHPEIQETADQLSGQPFGSESDSFYRVQIFSSSSGQKSAGSIQEYFKLSQPVTKEFSEGYYRYYVGEFDNEAEAKQLAASLRLKPGLKGAFVVKYVNGSRELTHPK
ncbi:MAG: SPOR domain-containing protein, partial [Bacteroidales bacterium]|nr:SPOR domain-containing protein [Bacteroidales bacterium]